MTERRNIRKKKKPHQKKEARLDGYRTTRQTAEFLNKSIRTLELWARRGYGPPRTKIGNLVLYKNASLERWLEEQEEAAA